MIVCGTVRAQMNDVHNEIATALYTEHYNNADNMEHPDTRCMSLSCLRRAGCEIGFALLAVASRAPLAPCFRR